MTLFLIACFLIIAAVAGGAYLATWHLSRAAETIASIKSDLRPKEPK